MKARSVAEGNRRTPAIVAGLWLGVLSLGGLSRSAFGQASISVERGLEEAQFAMLQRHYGEAIRVLERALARSPSDNRLRVEIARAWVYKGEDRRAIRLFRDVLRQEPTNRSAKLGLAQVLGYRGDLEESNRLYRELLAATPADEAAAIGLVNNLMRQKRAAEASRLARQALVWHPNSLRLQEYKDRLEQGHLGPDERVPRRTPNAVLGYGDYVADSEGNRFWQLSQRFDSEIARVLSNRLLLEERRLWRTGEAEPPVTVASATDDMKLRLTNPVWLTGSVGLVRFPDGAGVLFTVAVWSSC